MIEEEIDGMIIGDVSDLMYSEILLVSLWNLFEWEMYGCGCVWWEC